VVLANPGIDRVLQDTVVAHFHYALSLGDIFAIFAGWYYWLPKITGYMYSETFGKLLFWLTFVGVNLAFFLRAGADRRTLAYQRSFPSLFTSVPSSLRRRFADSASRGSVIR
jgi:heme/copper-type cytochrome/quinol oxidase subunit 1